MRKLFSLIAAVLFAGSIFAATEVTFTPSDFSGQGTNSTGSAVSATKSGVTVSANKAYGTTQLRVYAHSTFVVESESLNIAKLNFTFSAADKTGGLDAEVVVGAKKYEVADLASQARFTEIKVTLAADDEVLAPAIVGDAQFFDEQEITITCGTDGAAIYYTTNGDAPTSSSTLYESAFNITETCTVKAIAIKGEGTSDVTSATFKKAGKYASFEALVAADLANNTLAEVTFSNVEIDSIYVNSKSVRKGLYLPIMDKTGTKPIELYYNNGDVAVPAAWVAGGTVSGTVQGNWTVYNGQWELVPSAADWTWAQVTYVAPAPTAIDNAAVEGKAVKTIKNGQLLIEKNGVVYNVLGEVVR